PGLSINGFIRASNNAVIFLPMKPFAERRGLTGDDIAASLNRKLGAIDDAFIAVLPAPPIRGFGPAGGLKLQIEDRTASGTDNLYAVTQDLLAEVRQTP